MSEMTPKPKYSDAKLKKLLEQIHDGIITPENLPTDLYKALGNYYTDALFKGFGSTLVNVSPANEAILTELHENVWLFSAAKTYSFTNAASSLLVGSDGAIKPFSQFYAEGQAVAGNYLDSWARAEYNTVIANAQMAEQWQSIERNKDILPMLTFSTAGHACPECLPFEGLTRPVTDPIWNKVCPTLHFNCMCILIPSDDAELSSEDFVKGLPVDTIDADFQNNPGKTGEIFTPENPYFADVPKKLAAANFGLEMPNET